MFYDSLTLDDDPGTGHRSVLSAADLMLLVTDTNAAAAGGLSARRSRGSIATPSAIANGDAIFYGTYAEAFDGTDWLQVGQMLFSVSGTVSTGIVPTRFGLSVMDDTGALWEPLVVESTRDVFPDGIWRDMVLNGPAIDGDWNAWGGHLNYPTLAAPRESVTISGTGASGTIHLETLDRTSKFITANSTGNFTINLRGNSSWTLDQTMQTGDQVTFVLAVTNGSTAYRATSYTIDGSPVTPKWAGGVAPIAGAPNATDIYTITVTKTASATFAVWASMGTVA